MTKTSGDKESMVAQKTEKEPRNRLFKRIATMRTRKVLRAIKVLGNCANTKVYEYSAEEIDTIFSAIENEVKRVKSTFEPSKNEFSL